MDIILYNTSSRNNEINKLLFNEALYSCYLYNDVGVYNPVIELESDIIIDNNFAFIPEFKKFYYVNDITINSDIRYTLTLDIDVLMSYKTEILEGTGVLIKTNGDELSFIPSPDYVQSNKHKTDIYYSDVELINNNSNIIVTWGDV